MSQQKATDAFSELAMPLFEPLYNFACWLARDRTEAEDLVQETYAKALRAFSSFEPGTNFRAWMFRILRNTFLNSRTGLQATATVSLNEDEDSAEAPSIAETPESLLLRRSDWQLVHDGIAQLPLPYREVLLLCDLEEFSYKDISAALGIPIGTVMSRLSRARAALRAAVHKLQKGAAHGV